MNRLSLFQALGGGVLIGTAAVLLLWSTGRIAGVSSVAGNLIFSKAGDRLWRVLFLLGLVAGAAIYYTVYGNAPVARHDFPAGLLAAAGLLVGFGTSLGRGCTSGHGVCGLGRLSKRSLAATITFLSIGIATAVIARHAVGVA